MFSLVVEQPNFSLPLYGNKVLTLFVYSECCVGGCMFSYPFDYEVVEIPYSSRRTGKQLTDFS